MRCLCELFRHSTASRKLVYSVLSAREAPSPVKIEILERLCSMEKGLASYYKVTGLVKIFPY